LASKIPAIKQMFNQTITLITVGMFGWASLRNKWEFGLLIGCFMLCCYS